jgi:hypothetical protein
VCGVYEVTGPAGSVDFGALAGSGLVGTVPLVNLPAASTSAGATSAGMIPYATAAGTLDPSWIPFSTATVSSFSGSLSGDVVGTQSATLIGPGVGFGVAGSPRFIYVNATARASPAGDRSMARPFQTLTAAAAAANQGDVLLLKGTFSESPTFTTSVTLDGLDRSYVIINGMLVFQQPSELRNLSVSCTETSGAGCVKYTGAGTLRMRSVDIANSGSTSGSTVTNNTAVNMSSGSLDAMDSTFFASGWVAYGVTALTSSTTHVLRSCTVHVNGNTSAPNLSVGVLAYATYDIRDTTFVSGTNAAGLLAGVSGQISNSSFSNLIILTTPTSATATHRLLNNVFTTVPSGNSIQGTSGATLELAGNHFYMGSGATEIVASSATVTVISGGTNDTNNTSFTCAPTSNCSTTTSFRF